MKGKMEDITLPVAKVDIIISEWMGYCLLFESMLDTVLKARDRYLAPGGLMLPDRACLQVAAIEDSQYKQQKFGLWDNLYGVSMRCIKKIALSEPLVDLVETPLIMSTVCTFLDLDLYTVAPADLDFARKYQVEITRDDTVHALAVWFDVHFSKLQHPATLSTSPYQPTTHWRHTVFYMDQLITAQAGQLLTGSIAFRKSHTNFRDLDIKISYHYNDAKHSTSFTQMYKLI